MAAKGITDNPIRDAARAIREHHEKQPAPRQETAREARWRVQRERDEADAKKNPHKGY